MNAVPATALHTRAGYPVPLTTVSATGRLHGLLFELTVEQHYRNTTEQAIETVYTFPLPLNAVLLGFDLELNGQRHTARAIERNQAEARYERAIDAGDSAALLVDNGNGLYTVQLANLLPGESAVLRYRYAELLNAHRHHVRLRIPTVIAPRYGDPGEAGLEGPALPGVDVLAEYPFRVTLELAGLHNPEAVRSPSHRVEVKRSEGGLNVALSRHGFLDRDFILELDESAVPREALIGADGEGFVVLASPVLPPERDDHESLALKILIDCSGSMAGASIEAAKRALLRLFERLEATDRVSLTRFGSRTEHVSDGLEPADAHTLRPLEELVARMEADLGGTEMASAIKATLVIPTAAGSRPDLILITDGQIHGSDTVVALGANSGHRLFVLAIGSAPNEALARRISEATGGACEFAATAGEVESAVLRLFSRLRSAPRTLTAVDWPSKPTWTLPAPKGVFPEDTVHLIAGFPTRPSGVLQVSVTDASGHSRSIRVPLAASLTSGDTLARMAAAQRLASLPKSEALALAVRHQLASVHTSFVLVVEREGADANALPSTVTVSQMLAAGWGGTALYRHVCGAPPPQVGSADALLGLDLAHERQACPEAPYPEFAERAKMRELRSPSKKAPETKPSKEDLWMLLRALEQTYAHGNPMPASFAELASRYPVAPALREALKQLIDECGAYTEAECIAAFLALLAAHSRDTAEPEFKKHLISQFTFSRKTRALRQRLLQEVLS